MAAKRGRRSPKHENVLALVREHLNAGSYLDTRHALERRAERQITRPEALYVLRHGRHEKRKDEFKEEHRSWTYAIRGKTVLDRLRARPKAFKELYETLREEAAAPSKPLEMDTDAA